MPNDIPADAPRRGNWMLAYSGKRVYPVDPRPEDFDIKDIARGLSHMCRFNGHTSQFYSVAQHSVLCAYQAPQHLKLDALLHDASEAYIADIVRPAKGHLPDYLMMEGMICVALAERFGLQYPLPAEIKDIDNRMLVTEAPFLLRGVAGAQHQWWKAEGMPAPYDIAMRAWTPEHARQRFMEAYDDAMAIRSAA
jgi:hypothetical protein